MARERSQDGTFQPTKFGHLFRTPLYRSWVDMKTRCSNPNAKSYKDYGGRGITYTEAWESFDGFAEDMAASYFTGATIERKDVNGNYEPSNCRWATRQEQMRNYRRNRVLEFNGIAQTVAEWSEQLGIKSTTIRQRLDAYGWTVEQALTGKRG